MPVDFERYDPDDAEGRIRLTGGTNAQTILEFLVARPERGFTPKEISEATGVPRGSVGTTLARLEERDLVRHKEPYWAIGEDDDRLAAYEGMIHGLEAIDGRAGDDEWGDWEATAVDPRGADE
jgi:DNA-binding transcriptional ArsR family regulator